MSSPYKSFTVPDSTDPPDGPHDFRALADSINPTSVLGPATEVSKSPAGATGPIGNTAWAQWTVASTPATQLARAGLCLVTVVIDVTIAVGGGYFTARISGHNSSAAAVFENAKRQECRPQMLAVMPAGPIGWGLDVAVFAAAGATVNAVRWDIFSTGGIT